MFPGVVLLGVANRAPQAVEVTLRDDDDAAPFALASCDGAPDVLNINAVEDVTEERRPLVRHATLIFDLVRGDALPARNPGCRTARS